MSKELPRLVRADRRAILFEECSHADAVKVDGNHVSFSLFRDKGNGSIHYSEWLDTQENRDYVADSKGELCYCRIAEVRGPGLGNPEQPTPLAIPTVVTFVNYDGEEVVVHQGDRIEITVNDEGMAYVSKL